MDNNWTEIYNAYPVNKELIWLNNCGTTPASQFSVDKVSQFLNAYSKRGILADFEKLGNVRKSILNTLSSLLNCNPEELAIMHNTAEGINFISRGLSFKKGDEILLMENEYPSNVYPWEHWKEKGVLLNTIPVGKTQDDFLKNFKSLINANTKMISISSVHWCTGMPLPLKEVGEICKKSNILFVLDGAQGVGHIPLNLKEFNIDFMAFPAWKWLLGPLGLGVMYVSSNRLDKLVPIFKGTGSVKDAENYLPYKTEWKDTSERYEYSTPNFNDWIYFKAILDKLNELGFENIRKRLFELTSYLAGKLKSLGFQVSLDAHGLNSGIIVAYHNKISSAEIVNYLKSKDIITADRLGGVRFAPHIYNSFEQLDDTIEEIKKII